MEPANAIRYLIQFLLGKDNEKYSKQIQYVPRKELKKNTITTTRKIFIVRSEFFSDGFYGEKDSLPQLPLKRIGTLPFLYGEAKEEIRNGNLILHADLIASAYFFVSRYEEMVLSELRDLYGNFPARESLLFRAGLLERPIVDEYRGYLLEQLQNLGYPTGQKKENFHALYFTHDVDVPFERFDLKKTLKVIGKGLIQDKRLFIYPLFNLMGNYKINPRDTFAYMLTREKEIKDSVSFYCESICFIIAATKDHTYNASYIRDRKTPALLKKIQKLGSTLGLHASYLAAEDAAILQEEKEELELQTGTAVYYNRNHYLRQLQPGDLHHLIEVGITDDFTSGFNEMPGFRLGTCWPVEWIDPNNGQVTTLTLHPLHIMDGSLDGKKPYQLELPYDEALKKCRKIIDQVHFHRGELCILWHNGMFSPKKGNYQKKIYDSLLDYILIKSKDE